VDRRAARGRAGVMEATMSETEQRPPSTGLRAVASLAGAILYGRRPEDTKARKRATVGGIAMAVVSILGGVVYRGEVRTDRMLAEQREDLRASVKATQQLAENVGALAAEFRETRTTLLEKIPDATPVPRPASVQPLPARRRP